MKHLLSFQRNPAKIASLYIHIPFCLHKCLYCDFYSLGIGKKKLPETEFFSAMQMEIQRWQKQLNPPMFQKIKTLFWGGGTPSMLSASFLEDSLTSLKSDFEFEPDAEITLEMNPKTANYDKLLALKSLGINRISLGVQSLQENLLDALGRAHSADEALQSLEWIIAAQFPQWNLDLMYGLPRQSLEDFAQTLERLSAFPISHLSAYELIIEEGTPFAQSFARGELPLPSSEASLEMRALLEKFLSARSLARYEVSNYALPGCESRHNQAYWNYDFYLGFGPGAVSFLPPAALSSELLDRWDLTNSDIYGLRLTNRKDLDFYLQNSELWEGVSVEPIALETAQGEFMMVGLRQTRGISFENFENKFQAPLPQKFYNELEKAQRRGWLEMNAGTCHLTEEGMLMSNELLVNFLA